MPAARPWRTLPVIVVAVVALLVAPVVAVSAGAVRPAAATGSVPAEVSAYVGSGALVARLDDLYGQDAAGGGIDFDDTTKAGAIVRVYGWTPDKLEGRPTDHPVELRNEWIVPITIADAPVGVATVWINPGDAAPELAEFVADAELAVALSAVPSDAALVHDDASSAWFALAAGVLTPLVPGTSGLETPAPVDDVAILPPEPAAATADPAADAGIAIAIGVVVLLVLVAVAALVIPARLARRRPIPARTERGGSDTS